MHVVPESESRWIFSDFDGTIMQEDGEIPASARETLAALRAAGHRIVLSTGRSAGQLPDVVHELGFDAIITGSGWRVQLADGSVLVDAALDSVLAGGVVSVLEEAGIPFFFETHTGLLASAESFAHLVAASAHIEPASARQRWLDHLDEFGRELVASDGPIPAGITKLVHMRAIDHVAATLPEGIRAMPSSVPTLPEGWGEIIPKDIHKAVAVLQVLEHFGVDVSRSIAIGDGANDVEMIAMAGVGVAMGNACAEVLEVADLVTSSVDDGGFAEAFRTIGLIEKAPASSD